MIKIEKLETYGWEAALRGMRNPMNSWDKSDSIWTGGLDRIGENDFELMVKLSKAGTDHRKFLRMITISCDITAPLYWWKEFDTYKVGTVANSCSTMHKIMSKEFTKDDFSCEYLTNYYSGKAFDNTIELLNVYRDIYNDWDTLENVEKLGFTDKKNIWYNIIQILPSSYNQKRTVLLNYEVLINMYGARRNHKLKEWRDFCEYMAECLDADMF